MATVKTTKAVAGPAVKVLEGADAIGKAIESIAKRGKALEKDLHAAAVSCLIHADKHGDITLANRLVHAVPGLTRKNAMRDWFIAFGKFSWNEADKVFSYAKDKTTILTGEINAYNTPFWEYKPEPAYKPFDLGVALANLIKKAEHADALRGDKVPADMLAKLHDLVKRDTVPSH